MKVLFGASLLLLVVGCQPGQTVVLERSEASPPGITVSGTATVRAVPTLVVLRLGAVVTDARPDAAKARAVAIVKKVVASTQALGVAPGDVQTSRFQLASTTDSRSQVIGWKCVDMLEISVKQVEKADAVLSAALAAGANNVEEVEYTIEEFQDLRAKARDQACGVAKAKAEQYARNFGVALGKPTRISENGPQGWWYGRNTAVQNVSYDSSSALPVHSESVLSAGSVSVELTVNVVYDLK